MKTIMAMAWILIGILGVFYHKGPGKKWQQLDQASAHLEAAEKAASDGNWEDAETEYSNAQQFLTDEQVSVRQRIEVERAKAQMQTNRLPEAWMSMQKLNFEMRAQPEPERDELVYSDAQKTLASSQFYLTWLMRLEGRPREDWEPEIESARQIYKHLAEKADAVGNQAEAAEHEKDLDAAIRLARMDLAQLQGRTLPKQCSGCCSGNCKASSKPKKSNKKGKKKPEDARGASSGPPPDNGGS